MMMLNLKRASLLRPKNVIGCCRRHRLQSSASRAFSSDARRKGGESSIERVKKNDVNGKRSSVHVERFTASFSSSTANIATRNDSMSNASSTASTGSIPVVDVEKMEMTRLVDDLLWKTQQQMMKLYSKNAHHVQQQHHEQHHIIAFSGGVDSSLAAALVHRCAQQQQQRQLSSSSHSATEIIARAVLGTSPAVPAEQIQQAEEVAQHIGIDFAMVPTTEGQDEMYIANAGQACLACKTHLYSTLQAIAQHASDTASGLTSTTTANIASSHTTLKTFAQPSDNLRSLHHHELKNEYHSRSFSTTNVQLYNGTNADDLLDQTRLGLIAANDYRVHAPLQDLTKNMVRQVARHLGLPNWNHAAQPCLRSRLALGVPATQRDLQRIERAERFVRNTLLQQQLQQIHFQGEDSIQRFDETCNMRVRLFSGDRACIEVDAIHLRRVEEVDWNDGFLVKDLNFSSISTRAFKSGSVAAKMATTVAKKTAVPTSRGRATNETFSNENDRNDETAEDQVSITAASL